MLRVGADIGGISPGSMPPHSHCLAEEGAAIISFKLVQQGRLDEAGITQLLLAPGQSGMAGVSGTRNLQDNLSDLKAQVRRYRYPGVLILPVAGTCGPCSCWCLRARYC
jgi:5-oxoprolinase (ATP-hydrolysing)